MGEVLIEVCPPKLGLPPPEPIEPRVGTGMGPYGGIG